MDSNGEAEGFGFTIVNREHQMYMQNRYSQGKMHGRQVFDYLYWGFRTEEYYDQGEPCGVWKYKTIKGYEYIFEVYKQKQIVRFPFLTKGYYKGEVDINCDIVELTTGAYYTRPKEAEVKGKAIKILNCKDFLKIKDIRKEFFAYEEVIKVIQYKSDKEKRLNSRSGNEMIKLSSNCYFKGNIRNGIVSCAVIDLAPCLFDAQGNNIFKTNVSILPKLTKDSKLIEDSKQVDQNSEQFNYSYLKPQNSLWSKIESFSGVWAKGNINGFCKIIFKDQSFYSGIVSDTLRQGPGFSIEEMGNQLYKGSFDADVKNGQGLMLNFIKNTISKGNFSNGTLNGTGFLKKMDTGVQYFGDLQQGLKHGHGSLKFKNKFTFEGNFEKDKILSNCAGKLIEEETESVKECRVRGTSDLDVSLGTTGEGCFLLDFRKGMILKQSKNL